MENGGGAAEKKITDDVVLMIASPREVTEVDKNGSYRNPQPKPADEIAELKNPTPIKPPKIPPEPTRSFSLSLQNSRFAEPPSPRAAKPSDENTALVDPSSANLGTLEGSLTTPLTGSTDNEGHDESSSLTVDTLEDRVIWGLRLWKWCVLVMVILCGRLFSSWSINVVVFLIEKNFLLKEKVLYFVYGVKTSVQVFIWLCLVLLSWVLLLNRGVERSKDTTRILSYVTRALAALLIGAAIWLLKTLFVKSVASKYQCKIFFERIRQSITHQHLVKILSVSKTTEIENRKSICCKGLLCFINTKEQREEKIDVVKLNKVNPGKVSAWTMKELVDITIGSGLSIESGILESYDNNKGKLQKEKIDSEKQAKAVADRIFQNVTEPGAKNMEEEELLKFMQKKDVKTLLDCFGASETKKIGSSEFKDWLVRVYVERKSLTYSLNDTKTAIEELNRLLSAVVLILAVLVWLLMMGFLTTQIIVLISSQLLLAAFMFGNAAKTVFEALIFVFVMHPFDVHDRCVIDGVQMVVEEMNILTTIFLRYDGEKVIYPNSVLSTKPISNFNRSPPMDDSVLFDIHISTRSKSISDLKDKIEEYLKSKPDHWKDEFTLLVKEIENVNKMKMVLYVKHTMNFQDYLVKSIRRSELVLKLKEFFEELGIKYNLLPLEVHVKDIWKTATTLAG